MFRRQIELKATRNNCRLVKSNNEKAKIVNIVEITVDIIRLVNKLIGKNIKPIIYVTGNPKTRSCISSIYLFS